MAKKTEKKKIIAKSMTFGEIMQRNPDAAEILMNKGLHCIGCHMAMYETLEQGAIMHGLNPDKLVKELNKGAGGKIDLHLHTKASDGRLSLADLIKEAIKKGARTIAVTDHDSTGSLKDIGKYGSSDKIDIIPGIEISCEDKNTKLSDIHIVGLFINYKNKDIKKLVRSSQESRIKQKQEMIKKLQKLGYKITFEELKKEVGESFGRPHIARILIRKGYFKNVQEVFDELLDINKKAYVAPPQPSIREAVNTIHSAEGIAILAHPGFYSKKNFKRIFKEFTNSKGDGIEADYPYYSNKGMSKEESEGINLNIRKIAEKNNLLVSGGTDFHGEPGRDAEIGSHGINEEELNNMKKRLRI